MYRQQAFAITDPDDALDFVASAGPAHLVTIGEGRLISSFVPMLLDPPSPGSAGLGSLVGHLARGNPQWKSSDPDTEALAIFTGNDAYVSPSSYPSKVEHGKVVPTWNYTVVQVHGRFVVHDDLDWVTALVARLTGRHEHDRPAPWSIDDTPDGYIAATARAIVGIEIEIARIDGSRKLSQNRSEADVAGVIEHLDRGSAREQAVATDMRAVSSGPCTPTAPSTPSAR